MSITRKVRWGVIGVARIAVNKVIPAMQAGQWSEIAAIASRQASKAESAAAKLGIPKSYGSYEELLRDPEIEAVYNPLPNHLHVPVSIQAAEHGKHVLCEKPVALNAAECRLLQETEARTGVKIGEAFMVRSHPQWLRARELVQSGAIGELRAITAVFSYNNPDPNNIRNRYEQGGGALMDIGCYPIQIARFVTGHEPVRVVGLVERDPQMPIDRLTSALIQFPSLHLLFTSSTQMIPRQRVQIFGTRARIEIEIPFNAPPDRPTRICVDRSGNLVGSEVEVETFPVTDQYTLQGDAFSRAIRENGPVPTPLSDSEKNMIVIDAVFESAKQNAWVNL